MEKKPCVYLQAELHPEQKALLDAVFCVVGPDEAERRRDEVVAIVSCKGPKITRELFSRFPSVKVVGNHGVGYDHIDLELCKAHGVRVSNTPNVLSGTTADMAFALLLATARRVAEGNAVSKNGKTSSFYMNWFGLEVCGATLGIVGMGNIGMEIAKRAGGFDMKILYHNRRRRSKEEEEKVGASYVDSLHDLLRTADFVVASAPGTKENYHLFGSQEFSIMKRTAVFVNIARGSLVDHDALAEALREGRVAAAGLDVTDPEPLPRDHPLLSLSNVTITPHSGSATLHCRKRMTQLMVDNITAALQGHCMPSEVTA